MRTPGSSHHSFLTFALKFGLLLLGASLSTSLSATAAGSSESSVSDFSMTPPESIRTGDIEEALALPRGTRIQRTTPPAVRLPVFFEFDSATLRPEAEALLSRVGEALVSNELAEYQFSVEGHTDSVGPETYNASLSRQRAEAVKAFLVARGVPEHRLGTLGRGEEQPVASNQTEPGRQRNRRVEVINRGTAR